MEGGMEEEDGEKLWKLIPHNVWETCVVSRLDLQAIFSMSMVSKECYELPPAWAVFKPLFLEKKSNHMFKYCLLKKVLPLPEGVEALENGNGSSVYAVSVINFPYHLAVAKQSGENFVWNITVFKLDTDHFTPRWELVLQVKGTLKDVVERKENDTSWFKIYPYDGTNGRHFHLLFFCEHSQDVHFY